MYKIGFAQLALVKQFGILYHYQRSTGRAKSINLWDYKPAQKFEQYGSILARL